MHGGIPGHESCEVSWDAQADLEYAIIAKLNTILLMVDYFKFFHPFDHQWARGFLFMLHFPKALVENTYSMYSGLLKSIKIGVAYGDLFSSYSGMGQGDIATLFPALALCQANST